MERLAHGVAPHRTEIEDAALQRVQHDRQNASEGFSQTDRRESSREMGKHDVAQYAACFLIFIFAQVCPIVVDLAVTSCLICCLRVFLRMALHLPPSIWLKR